MGALFQIALVDVAAVVAHRIGDIEREVVASLLGVLSSYLEIRGC